MNEARHTDLIFTNAWYEYRYRSYESMIAQKEIDVYSLISLPLLAIRDNASTKMEYFSCI
jgi:hypothetical protein